MLDQDRGLLYAEACFETVRVLRGEIFRWDAHMHRLRRGLAAYGLAMPRGMDRVLRQKVLARAADTCADVLARVTLTGGATGRGLMPRRDAPEQCEPNGHVHVWPWRDPGPAHLRSVKWPLPLADRPAKWTSDYGAAIRALRALHAAGVLAAGEEALVLDADGRAVSAPTANVLFCVDGRWVTPPVGAGVLPGVVRAALLESGATVEADCDAAMLARCEAAALSASGVFIRPAWTLDGRPLSRDGRLYAPLWSALAGQPGVPRPGRNAA